MRATVFRVEPYPRRLRLYGQLSDRPSVDWAWVDGQLANAGTYWVVARAEGHPHPRPVWGVWHGGALHVSVGSPALLRGFGLDPRAAVHLDSGVDVVIVECHVVPADPTPADVLAAYDAKYDWSYDLAEYGNFIRLDPSTVLAWRSAGLAGRGGFRTTGRWDFRDER